MTSRPPPDRAGRHYASSRVAKREFEQVQRDLQALVKRIGFDNLPLNDESLRPALKLMWDFAEERKERVWVFDMADKDVSRGCLYFALRNELLKIWPLSRELGALLDATYKQDQIARIKPVFTVIPGGLAMLYFEGVYTPMAALQSRRH